MLWSIHTTATQPTGETPSSSSTEQKQSSLTRSSIAPHGSWHLMTRDRTSCGGWTSCWGRNTIGRLRYEQQDTSRRCGGITIAVSTAGRSKWGDLVLRRVLSREGLHKLSPMWEGPFKVVHVSRPGAARLETQDGVPIQNTWNIQHLRKFYP